MSSPKLRQTSWILYDFANTIFSMNIVSLHFALWVTKDQGGNDLQYGLTYSGSMLAVIFLAPFLGKWADLHLKRRLFLIFSTLICVISTACIGILNELTVGLLLFFVANIGYQLAQVFYDSLLPAVAEKREYGRISGLGVSLGYAGAILGIIMVSPFIHVGDEILRHRAFLPTAVLFLVFALPCFIFVREVPQRSEQKATSMWKEIWQSIFRYPGVLTYLGTMFLVQNAANTIILFMGVYSFQVGGFTQDNLNVFFILATLVALISAYIQGRLVDRLGPRRVFRAVILIWLLAILVAGLSVIQPMFWVGGFLIGVGLGGIWTSARALLLSLIPPEESGTFFGFNVLAGRFAALIGPICWGLIIWLLEPLIGVLSYRIAVLTLGVFIILGFWLSGKIPEPTTTTKSE